MRQNPLFFAQTVLPLFMLTLAYSAIAGDFDLYAPLTPLQEHLLEGFIGFLHCSFGEGKTPSDKERDQDSYRDIILDFQAHHKTCAWHWFPMQETRPGGDPLNNLYAKDGCLDKLDKVTGGRARQYEYDHNRKAKDAGKQFAWWGHSNNASEAACILTEPKKSVVIKGKDDSEVRFSKNDIQGLLTLMSSSLVARVDFVGERSSSNFFAEPNDPKPELFLKTIEKWSADGLPFVLDIDRGEQVWNYPYDHVKIAESDEAPVGFDASSLPRDGSVKYYHIDMSGTGFDSMRRVYKCYVQRAVDGHVIKSGWIKTPNSHENPDFMWRPHPIPDLMNKDNWVLRGRPSNPMIDPKTIYYIYMKSLQ